jgi:hypothetical protein
MDANPEVMPQSGTMPATKGAPTPRDVRGNDASTRQPAALRNSAAPRTSEDPLRRTDRYRLVMPWSSRL